MALVPRRSPALAVLGLSALLGACGTQTQPEQPSATPAAAPATAPAAATTPAARPAPASPRDTARATLAGQTVMVDYGRPYMRGRTIMGGLVPYGQVWRTGANAATTLVTATDVSIGGTRVPAGTYTLYTLPGQNEWQLIINRQTGQWGTVYDQAQDLARVPLRMERTAAPVEQFTIRLQPAGSALTLVMEWENTRLTAPIQPVSGTE
ncbi:MAG TPA: DUF2911 domain-containing protein [Longimicrobium sp.]|jgi:hypothetical protein|uniref:DUF2911 domain-containing protein n=1 Tax=Longimicrobium sp. TaxID=2029185 RepID=UPI002ED7920D